MRLLSLARFKRRFWSGSSVLQRHGAGQGDPAGIPAAVGSPPLAFHVAPRSRNEMEERTGVAPPTEEQNVPPCPFSRPAPSGLCLCRGMREQSPPARQQLCPPVPGLLETPVKHPLIQALFPAKLKQELTQKPPALLHAASFTFESSAGRGLPLGPTQAGRGQGPGGAATSPSPAAGRDPRASLSVPPRSWLHPRQPEPRGWSRR